MSPDEALLERVVAALKKVKLEAILVGNVAAVLQDVPVMTANRPKDRAVLKLIEDTIKVSEFIKKKVT